MSNGDPFWGNDPRILVQPDAVLELLPSSAMTPAERYNAVARVILLISVLIAGFTRKAWPLAIGAAALAIDYFAYKNDSGASDSAQAQRAHSRDTYFAPLEQPIGDPRASRGLLDQSQAAYAPDASEWAPHVSADGSISRRDVASPEAHQPAQNSPDLWRSFVAGPGGNQVNDQYSALERQGTNESHGMMPSEGFEDGPAPWSGGVTPNVGFSLDGADPLGSCVVPDLQASAVPSSFESKRLPKQTAAQSKDPFWNLNEPTRTSQGSFLGTADQGLASQGLASQGMPLQQGSFLGTSAQSLQGAPLDNAGSSQTPWISWEDEARVRQQQGQGVQGAQQGAPGQLPPVCGSFESLTESEKHNFIAREKRDNFIARTFQDLDEPLNERQFFTLPNFNELEDRERYESMIQDLMPHFKDKYSLWASKYFQ